MPFFYWYVDPTNLCKIASAYPKEVIEKAVTFNLNLEGKWMCYNTYYKGAKRPKNAFF